MDESKVVLYEEKKCHDDEPAKPPPEWAFRNIVSTPEQFEQEKTQWARYSAHFKTPEDFDDFCMLPVTPEQRKELLRVMSQDKADRKHIHDMKALRDSQDDCHAAPGKRRQADSREEREVVVRIV
jgi:hypothetical protein